MSVRILTASLGLSVSHRKPGKSMSLPSIVQSLQLRKGVLRGVFFKKADIVALPRTEQNSWSMILRL